MKIWLQLLWGRAALAGGMASAALVDRYLTALERKITLPSPVQCLHCGRTREGWDRVPLLSWLLNGGKCRFCGAFLTRREPILSALTILLWPVAVQLWLPGGMEAVLLVAVTGSALLCAAGICWAGGAERPVLLPVFLCTGIVSIFLYDGMALFEHLFGAAGMLVFCLLLRVLPGKANRLRLDSLCYMVCAGLQMGWKSCFAVLPVGVVLMGLFMLAGGQKAKSPYGAKAAESKNADPKGRGYVPDLCVLGGGAAALLFGRTLMNGYLRLFMQMG